jgi:hypothetical protein
MRFGHQSVSCSLRDGHANPMYTRALTRLCGRTTEYCQLPGREAKGFLETLLYRHDTARTAAGSTVRAGCAAGRRAPCRAVGWRLRHRPTAGWLAGQDVRTHDGKISTAGRAPVIAGGKPGRPSKGERAKAPPGRPSKGERAKAPPARHLPRNPLPCMSRSSAVAVCGAIPSFAASAFGVSTGARRRSWGAGGCGCPGSDTLFVTTIVVE